MQLGRSQILCSLSKSDLIQSSACHAMSKFHFPNSPEKKSPQMPTSQLSTVRISLYLNIWYGKDESLFLQMVL